MRTVRSWRLVESGEATDEHGFRHSNTTQSIIGVFFEVYNELGAGFLESVYVEAMTVALRQSGLRLEREMPLDVRFP
jgi:hypothetical protein